MEDVQKQFREYVRLDRRRQAGSLSPREYERWSELKQALNARFAPPARPEHEERRASVRVPVRLEVRFRSAGELRRSLLTNMSRGGVFVATRTPAPVGSIVGLRIVLPSEGTEIEVEGEVVSHNVGPDLRPGAQGMGVRFAEVPREVQQVLDRLYEGALD